MALLHNPGSDQVTPVPGGFQASATVTGAEPVEGIQHRVAYMRLGHLSLRLASRQSFAQ